ncbi:MAG TPA: hypothetical protein DCW74_19870 [Alteromonas australica]|uniref:Uncharacterized protein n=1 Tax=Alteromonas australica TaxID=589873 RepID=A0A350P9L3_9ALTE|nr:hypothetical protein [Alteromonas australica]|tara:strand:- start:150 stop:551 length:402 start_codon:yes stop_codon:yes gene_type:complete
MSQIGVSFTPSAGSPVYSIVFDNFLDEGFPRNYQGEATFSQSANGATILDGPAYRQKYIWVISSLVPHATAISLDALFQAWDLDRSNGLPVACGVVDMTFGATVTTSAVFSTPPTYTYMGGDLTMVTFGLTEI